MKKVALLLTLALLVFYGCSRESEVINESETENLIVDNRAPNNGSSASGQGTLTNPDGTIRHFSFHAREKKDGSVDGNGVLTYNGGLLKIKFDVDCLEVIGNVAQISGIVTSWSDNPNGEGRGVWFKVIDNGEGSNADPDEISRLGNSAGELDCTIDYGLIIYPIEGGNIQVRE